MKSETRLKKLEENRTDEVDPMVYEVLKILYGNDFKFTREEKEKILAWVRLNDPTMEKTIIEKIKVITLNVERN